MKKRLFFTLFVLTGVMVQAQYTAIPDANFEAALAAYDDIPGDNQVPTFGISWITYLNVSNQNITDLSGIEDFTALESLICSDNQLTSLDISQNTGLTTLTCSLNQLTSLDVSQNTNLTQLICYINQLTSLDVSQNTNLTTLWCYNNPLGSLDVSQNTNLTDLDCGDNQLTSLYLPQNSSLTDLRCENNQLTSLDVSQNTNLTDLRCYSNQLAGNLILSGLHALTTFSAAINPNLICVQVDNEADANAGVGIYANWLIDNTASYSESCGYTAIPDANFEAALAAYDDIPGDNQVPTANISGITSLNVLAQNIADLSGIEDFTALQTLDCRSNQLGSLDVSQNTALTQLWCGNNPLGSLDVSQNTALTELRCNSNQLVSLDVSQNIALTALYCFGNPLGSLDVSQNTNLTTLSCGSNQLSSLDVSQNISLTTLYCNSSQLSSLDVSQNTNLTTLYCHNNQLSSLDVSQNTALTNLRCHNNQLASLDVSQNTALTTLRCYNNQLSSLDVSQNTNLTTLHCYNNQLAGNLVLNGLNSLTDFDATNNPNLLCIQVDNKAAANTGAGIYTNWTIDGTASYSEDCLNPYTTILDASFEAALAAYDDIPGDYQVPTANISGVTDLDVSLRKISDLTGIEDFTALETLLCHNNGLTSLDLSQNSNLTDLSCFGNKLSSLNLSQNTNLTILVCQNNQLTSLDLSQNTNLTDMWCVNNPNLSCIEVADVADANAGVGIYAGWHKDATAGYSENCGGGANKGIVTDVTDQGAIKEVPFVVSDIILYPNPVKDDLYIALPAERELVSVIVYNGRGERVAESKTTGVSLTNLAAGMYFVKIELAGGARITKKVIISRN